MGIHTSHYVAYGVRIKHLPDEMWWKISDEQDGKVTDEVSLFTAGRYDQDDQFLTIITKEIKPGEPFLVPPYAATAGRYLRWDAALVTAAELVYATLVKTPGWFFIPDES